MIFRQKKASNADFSVVKKKGSSLLIGAEGETRTLTPKAPEPKSGVSTNSTTPANKSLKLRLEQLIKIWWPDLESNQGHRDFQSLALPTELSGQNRMGVLYRDVLRVSNDIYEIFTISCVHHCNSRIEVFI